MRLPSGVRLWRRFGAAAPFGWPAFFSGSNSAVAIAFECKDYYAAAAAIRVKEMLTRALASFVGPVCWFESIYSTSIYNQQSRHLIYISTLCVYEMQRIHYVEHVTKNAIQ